MKNYNVNPDPDPNQSPEPNQNPEPSEAPIYDPNEDPKLDPQAMLLNSPENQETFQIKG